MLPKHSSKAQVTSVNLIIFAPRDHSKCVLGLACQYIAAIYYYYYCICSISIPKMLTEKIK